MSSGSDFFDGLNEFTNKRSSYRKNRELKICIFKLNDSASFFGHIWKMYDSCLRYNISEVTAY